MNRRNLGTSSGRREKAVDKSAMERMVRQNRARRKKRRKDKSISLAATVSKNVIALATSLHGIGPLDPEWDISEESGRDRTAVASTKRIFTCSDGDARFFNGIVIASK